MRITTTPEDLFWTPLSMRMGLTNSNHQRGQILLAIRSMTWTATAQRLPRIDGAAARTIIAAVFDCRRDLIDLIGVAHLDGGRQLIGLQDTHGVRRYVLDLDVEAIHVLVVPGPPAVNRSRIA